MVLLNKLITPDGTILISRHRHDYVTYKDKNGKTYFIDGGSDYCRSSNNGDETWIQITTASPWETLRAEYGRWNIYRKEYTKLKDIPDSWLQNILDYYKEYYVLREAFFLYLQEKLYRAEKEIFVKEDNQYQIDFGYGY